MAGKVADDDDALFPPPPKKVALTSAPQFLVGVQLGKGGFGQVFKGSRAYPRASNPYKPTHVAIKFEHTSSKGLTSKGVPYEWEVYQQLGETPGVPRLLHKGMQDEFCVMIMELLGQSLWDMCNMPLRNCLSEAHAACVAVEAISILQGIHEKGYIHGDVKPENLCVGAECNGAQNKLYLLDLGLASRWRVNRAPNAYSQRPDDFRGTIRYASVHAHLGRAVSRRDDLESLAYTLLFLLDGELPWQGFTGENKGFLVAKQKSQTTVERLCRFHTAPFAQFLEYVLGLSFCETPSYSLCQALFEPLLEEANLRPMARSYQVATQAKVGSKRGRTAEEAPAEQLMRDPSGAPRKRFRASAPSSQFLTVYNHRHTLKQRYHYNVSTQRLDTHISYGVRDKLTISSVTSYSNLWAVVMDCDTQVLEQQHMLANSCGADPSIGPSELLPKKWITEQWNAGFFITALAGAQDGQVLVVMTKLAQPFQQQSYKVSSTFPSEWVRRKKRDGFYVTVMGCIGSVAAYQWVVVVTSGTGYTGQAIELDFVYPSEAIHHYWDETHRITVVACSPDQTAIALTKGAAFANRQESPQETLRTSGFPARHIKSLVRTGSTMSETHRSVQEKWDRDLYIGSCAWGPMV